MYSQCASNGATVLVQDQEKHWDSLARDDVAIKYVATDGDALASRAYKMRWLHTQDAMPVGMETQRQSDTTHLSQTQFRHIIRGRNSGSPVARGLPETWSDYQR